jgi:hypothetical protein
MKKARLILAISLMVVLFSSCVREPNYLYCDDTQITIVNNSHQIMYFSWTSDYCVNYLYPGESTTYYPYSTSVRIDLDNPEVQSFDYKFDNSGYSQYRENISIDDCSKVIYLN